MGKFSAVICLMLFVFTSSVWGQNPVVRTISFRWDGSSQSWLPVVRNTYQNNEFGEQLSNELENWDSRTQKWILATRLKKSYYNSKLLRTIEIESFGETGKKKNHNRRTYSYNSRDQLIEDKFEVREENTDWTVVRIYVWNYNSEGCLMEENGQNSPNLNGILQPNTQTKYQYTDSSCKPESWIEQQWDPVTNGWKDRLTTHLTYDANGREIFRKQEEFRDGQWILLGETQTKYQNETNTKLEEENTWYQSGNPFKRIYVFYPTGKIKEETSFQINSQQEWLAVESYYYELNANDDQVYLRYQYRNNVEHSWDFISERFSTYNPQNRIQEELIRNQIFQPIDMSYRTEEFSTQFSYENYCDNLLKSQIKETNGVPEIRLIYEYAKGVDCQNFSEEIPLVLFPNPASDLINVRTDALLGLGSLIRIIDVNGREVLRKNTFRTQEYDLDITGIMPGYYIIQCQVGNLVVKKPFLKLAP